MAKDSFKDKAKREAKNARRRKRYSTDADYRRAIRQEYRERYREQNSVEMRPDCRRNISRLASFGSIRKVIMRIGQEGSIEERLTFTMKETCDALGGYHYRTVYRWLTLGLLPRPVYVVSGHGMIYLAEEVRAIMTVLGEHQSRMNYYQSKHEETRRRIFAAVEAARLTL